MFFEKLNLNLHVVLNVSCRDHFKYVCQYFPSSKVSLMLYPSELEQYVKK